MKFKLMSNAAALDVVSLGVPVVDLAGKLICGKA